jgi:hypothetical protein
MHQTPLAGSFAKVEWAKSEINKLNHRVNAMVESWPDVITHYVNEQGVEVRRLATPPIPNDLNIEVGNIIQNLRAPLDKALSAIALKFHPNHNGVQFPFGKDEDSFEKVLAKQTKLPECSKSIIRQAMPYMPGNPVLCALHSLNIPDKHHPELVPIGVGAAFNLKTIRVLSGELFSIGPRRGRHFFSDREKNLRQPNYDLQPTIGIEGTAFIRCGMDLPNSDAYVSIFYNQMGSGLAHDLNDDEIPDFSGAPFDDLEVLTCSPGADLYLEIKPSFNIALGGVAGLERKPVFLVLREAAEQVERMLVAFESKFFKV